MSPSRNASERFSAVRMPVEEPIEDVEDAVQKLKQCSTTEIHRARQHHRRALESLKNGGYSSLSDSTRERLLDHLQTNLEALNQAMDADDAISGNEGREVPSAQTQKEEQSFSARLHSFLRKMWS